MFALVKFVVAILIMFKLIPKSQLMTQHDITILEDELQQLSKVNLRHSENLTNAKKELKDMEKRYQDSFLAENEAKENLKAAESRIKTLYQEKTEAVTAEEVATQQYSALQTEMLTATELSTKLKEALSKWMS